MNKNNARILFTFTLLLAAFVLAACGAAAPVVQGTPPREATATSQPTITPTQTITPTPTPTPTPDPNPRLITTLGEGMMSDIYRSPDGKMIVVGIGNDLRWFDSETFEEIGYLKLGTRVLSISFSDDSKFAIVDSYFSAKVVDLDLQEEVSSIHGLMDGVYGLSFTPDKQYIAFATSQWMGSSYVGLWNIETDKEERVYQVADPEIDHRMSGPAISPDGTLLAAGCDDQVYVWDLHSGEMKLVMSGHAKWVSGVAFSPDGKLLASSSWDQTVRLWDPITGRRIRTVSGNMGEVSDVAFSTDGQDLIITNRFGPSYIWNLTDMKLDLMDSTIPTPDPFGVEMHFRGYSQDWLSDDAVVVFSPDGRFLAAGSKPILIWDIETRSVVSTLEGDVRDPVADFQYSPDGQWLAAEYSYWNLMVWDVKNEKVQIRRESGYLYGQDMPDNIYAHAFSPDSKLIAVGGETTIEIWDIETASLLQTLQLGKDVQRVRAVSFSPDGRQLISVYRSNELTTIAEIWDVAASSSLRRFELPGISPHVFSANDLHWPYFACNNSGERKTWIEIWNLETEEIAFRLMPPGRDTASYSIQDSEPVQFSPDGSFLMGVSERELCIWDTATGELVLSMDDLDTVTYIAISANNELLAIDRDGKVDLYDISVAIQQRIDSNDWEENIPND